MEFIVQRDLDDLFTITFLSDPPMIVGGVKEEKLDEIVRFYGGEKQVIRGCTDL